MRTAAFLCFLSVVGTSFLSEVDAIFQDVQTLSRIYDVQSDVSPKELSHLPSYGTPGKTDRWKRSRRRKKRNHGFSLWIDEQQVKAFSGYLMSIHVITNGRVMPYILDPSFEDELPVIPFEVAQVNFTWSGGRKKYLYEFYNLVSLDESLVSTPVVSIPKKGRVPRRCKSFSINIGCSGKSSGIGTFSLGLKIVTRGGGPLPDTPLSLSLKKECLASGRTNSLCKEKCTNGGFCDIQKRCRCPEGYMGPSCQTALCYPQCRNEGFCSSPGRCTCRPGYQGRYCEGGMCRKKCLNGGKCIQKDTCSCRRGFYGNRCEFSKCVIPCVNGGKCRGVNRCRCPRGYSGVHCQIVSSRELAKLLKTCARKCKHGLCGHHGRCKCKSGQSGKWCKRRKSNKKRKMKPSKPKLWV